MPGTPEQGKFRGGPIEHGGNNKPRLSTPRETFVRKLGRLAVRGR